MLSGELIEFYAVRNLPVELIVNTATSRQGLTREQIEAALRIVYEDMQMLIEETPQYPWLSLLGKKKNGLYPEHKYYEKVILLRNNLKNDSIGREVYQVARGIRKIPVRQEYVPQKSWWENFIGEGHSWQYTAYL